MKSINERLTLLEKRVGIDERFFSGKEDSPYYSIAKKLKSIHKHFLKDQLAVIFESQSNLTLPKFLIRNLKSKLKFPPEYSFEVTNKPLFQGLNYRRSLFSVSNEENEFEVFVNLNSTGFSIEDGGIGIFMIALVKEQDPAEIATVMFSYTEKEYQDWETELYFEVAKRCQENKIPVSGSRGRALVLQVAKEMASELDFSIKGIDVYPEKIKKVLNLGYAWDLKNFRHRNKWA